MTVWTKRLLWALIAGLATLLFSGMASAAVPTPVVTLTPAGSLANGEVVTAKVSGFGPSEKVFLSECLSLGDVTALGCGAQLAAQPFALTDDRGSASVQFTVHATAAANPRDTAVGYPCTACVLVATAGVDGAHPTLVVYAVAPLVIRGALPVTGLRAGPLVWLAITLLAAGAAVTYCVKLKAP